MTPRPPGADAPAVDLAAAMRAAACRGDAVALRRLHAALLVRLRGAPAGDEESSALVQTLLLGLVQCGAYPAALAVARDTAPLLGYDRLAASELLPLLAAGRVAEARALAEALADAPVETGGHGLRAAVRALLGRDADAAADGAAFAEEARTVGRSLAAWRAVARRYAPPTAHVLSRYAALYAELERAFPGSRPWRGEPLAGRTVVLQLVEGLGDQIQGLRLARAVREAGGRVLLGCDDRLHALAHASGLAEEFVPRPVPARHELGPADFSLVVGAWLHESGLPPARWPTGPYLDVASAGEPELLRGAPGPRVGVVWAGNPDFALEPTRGMPYAALRRLVAAAPSVTWVGLLRPDHPRAAERRATPVTRRVLDAGPALDTLAGAARLLRALDLVVTTDTALAHLAGASGVRVWTLLGPTFNWRWRLDGETTPLYPSMRLVRDAARGDWHAAAERVARDLAALR